MAEDRTASPPSGGPVADQVGARPGQWVLLSYRLPREPSTPRITVWRKLKQLGVAQISDGLVTLPADARTREQLEWIAEEVTESGGTAGIWLAQPGTLAQERELATAMAAARAEEYQHVLEEAEALLAQAEAERRRAVKRLRAELHRIGKRDFFPPAERDLARAAVDDLAADAESPAARRAKPARAAKSPAKEQMQ
jgi:hypothetical protein